MNKKHEVIWLDKGYQPTYICYIPTKKSFVNLLKKFDISEDEFEFSEGDATCYSFINQKDGTQVTGVHLNIEEEEIRSKYNTLEFQGLVLHECIHVYQNIIDYMQEKSPSIEFEAYFLSGLYMMMMYTIAEYHGIDIEETDNG